MPFTASQSAFQPLEWTNEADTSSISSDFDQRILHDISSGLCTKKNQENSAKFNKGEKKEDNEQEERNFR